MKNIFALTLFLLTGNICSSQTTYTFTGRGNWSIPANWVNNTTPPAVLPSGSTINILPSPGDTCILDGLLRVSEGGNLNVPPGVNFIIKGNLVLGNNLLDDFPNKVGDTWVYLVNDTANGIISEYNLTVSVVKTIQLPTGINANMWVYTYPAHKDTNYVYTVGDTIRAVDPKNINDPYWDFAVKQYVIPSTLYSSWPYQTELEITYGNFVAVIMQADITVGPNYFPKTFHIAGSVNHSDMFISFYTEEWIKNGVGIVKRYYNDVNGSKNFNAVEHKTSWSLVSYHLN